MYPELFRIGDLTLSSFGVMMALCFLAGYLLVNAEARRKHLNEKLINNMFLASIIVGIVGAKILYLLENVALSELVNHPLHHFFSRGGFTFYGGFFGALVIVWSIAYKHKINAWSIGDVAAPALALAYSIGRIGCLLVGDDYGTRCDLPWAMAFPKGTPPTTETVHPTQIYETVTMFIVFLYLWRARKKNKPDGWLFSIYLVLAGCERFLIEFIRNTTPSPILNLSIAQVMAIVIIIVGAVKLYSTHYTAEPGKSASSPTVP